MSDKDHIRKLFEETFLASVSNRESAIELLCRRYITLNRDEAGEIVDLISSDRKEKDKEGIQLVATVPGAYAMKVHETDTVVRNMIEGAKSKIILTGYSISSYFNELIDVLIRKKNSGIFVMIFLDSNENRFGAKKLIENRSEFLHIYRYDNKDDPLSALHAKIISVDDRYSLITSANLSYHGQEKNIELGALITSEDIAHKIEDIFKELIWKKVFSRIK